MRDISIMVTGKETFSDALKKMQTSMAASRKDLGSLQKELDQLSKNKVTLKVEMEQAKNQLKQAQKAFRELGDEKSKNDLIMAQSNYDQVVQNLKLVEGQAKQTSKEMRNLTTDVSKAENRAGSGGKGILSSLSKAGLFQMGGQALSGLAGTLVTSAFGSTIGGAVSNVLGSAASGAAMGSVAGLPGAIVGGLVGAASGAIQSVTQVATEKDEAYKSAVQSLYDEVKTEQTSGLQSGSELAAGRETERIAFTTLLGSEEKSEAFLAQVADFAGTTPFQFEDLTSMSKTLLAYKYSSDEILPLLTKIGDAGSSLGMSGEDMTIVATMLGRMRNTGKTSIEYLNPLLERGIPVYDYLAKALGKTNKQVQDMLSKGKIAGADAAQIISDSMGEAFKGGMKEQAESYAGLMSTLEEEQDNMKIAMGEGYNETREAGINAEIAYLQGESGEKMKEANRAIGAFQADLENQKEAMIRQAMDNAMASSEYQAAQEAGNAAEQGRLLMQAKAEAISAYAATEGYQTQLAADTALIQGIQDTMRPEYYMAGYNLGKEFDRGCAAAVLNGGWAGISGQGRYVTSPSADISGNAWGINRVPYDNYLTYLHEGERVLTANQARQADSGAGINGGININVSSMTVRQESDIRAIASAFVREISKAMPVYTGG